MRLTIVLLASCASLTVTYKNETHTVETPHTQQLFALSISELNQADQTDDFGHRITLLQRVCTRLTDGRKVSAFGDEEAPLLNSLTAASCARAEEMIAVEKIEQQRKSDFFQSSSTVMCLFY